MKRINLLLMSMFACSAIAMAQVSTESYVRTRTMLKEDGSFCLDNIRYYDGLGRPMEVVQKGVTPSRTNLVSLQEYDAVGRESNTWLPVSSASDFIDLSAFKSSAPGNYGNDAYPYSKLVYESSPLKRIVQQYGPGNAWHNGHPTATAYSINLVAEPFSCNDYSVSSTGALIKNSTYLASLLHVTQTTDEDGNTSYVFVDKLGRTLMERQMKGSETHDTYYVYDDYNRLCFVLQPMYQVSADLDKYAFQYKYDTNDNCIWKKLLGVQYIEYVYDTASRLTFSQDGNQRASGKWTFYEYDNLNRLTCQGECTAKNAATNRVEHIRNFYDNYTAFRSATGNNNIFPVDSSGNSKGYQTGSIITVFGSTTKLYSAKYYDIKGNMIMKIQNNLLDGYDVTTMTYTFTDKPLVINHGHTREGNATITEAYSYTYDHADRLTKVDHTLNGVKVTLSANTYDTLGRLSTKSLHGSATNKLTYSYNIRNWLSGISSTRFTQNLYYNSGSGTTKYNGNISSMTWQVGGESTTRGYKFTYDGLNRLLNATYGEGTSINTNTNRFSENVTGYDKNGNIKALQRYGQTTSSGYGLIDNLTYTLTGNQLNRVDDAVTASAYNTGFEFKNGASVANEYTYDANGNLTKDSNKGITLIQYNVLNLPSSITFSDGSSITYIYAADGTKLRTVHKTGGTTTTTDYCGNVIYENNIAKLLLTEEGYVSLTDNKYHYYLQDHQGNNRVVINQSGSVEETNHYYPFGGIFAGTNNVQPYKYNGKEYDNRKGLNWYDYGARHYDAALGRWHTVDPMSEKLYAWFPYMYCLGDPVRYIDKDGEFPWVAGLVGGGFDYLSQVAVNRLEGKTWSASLTDIDAKSIVVSAGVSMTGVGLVGVVNKGIRAAKIAQMGMKTTRIVKAVGESAVDGTVSVASQVLKDENVSTQSVAIDIASGYIGGKAGNAVKTMKQNSSQGKLLHKQADHAKRVAGSTPRKTRVQRLKMTTQRAENYGGNAANAISTSASNIGSTVTKRLLDDEKNR